jgi:hypothetical protein
MTRLNQGFGRISAKRGCDVSKSPRGSSKSDPGVRDECTHHPVVKDKTAAGVGFGLGIDGLYGI